MARVTEVLEPVAEPSAVMPRMLPLKAEGVAPSEGSVVPGWSEAAYRPRTGISLAVVARPLSLRADTSTVKLRAGRTAAATQETWP